jgi:RNA polymerase sigma factor (sigma-70 family)
VAPVGPVDRAAGPLPEDPGRVEDPGAAHAERDRLLRHLSRLPSRQRAVLVLRYLEDLPDAVIASMLGVREVTVRSHAFHGLAALRESLTDEVAHQEGADR